MTDEWYVLSAIAVMAIATVTTRAVPFLLLRGRQHPLVSYLGRYLPPAVMTLLVIYSLREVPFLDLLDGASYVLAVVVTALIHLWRRNALLSIGAGTALFMWLQQSGVLSSG